MDFNTVSETFIQSVSAKRNLIPRKSLKYRSALEVFFEQTFEWADQQMDSTYLEKLIKQKFAH